MTGPDQVAALIGIAAAVMVSGYRGWGRPAADQEQSTLPNARKDNP
ncbi:hypothetical protein AB0O20_06775 [Streptomyces kronopolitis]